MSENIKVAIRLRPLISREIKSSQKSHWSVKDANCIYQTSLPTTAYYFDRVFDAGDDNEVVYKQLCSPIIRGVMEGINGTIFAYGQTSSGKSYTMAGEFGIIAKAIQSIFNSIDEMTDREFLLRVSYLQIYNEVVSDLLREETKSLKIYEDVNGVISVAGLKEIEIRNIDDVFEIMSAGDKMKHIGATLMNEKSSRSHSIFRMIVESRKCSDIDDAVSVAQLNLVDLAGSERISQTGSSSESGRFREGVHINKSLLVLSQVIRQLSLDDKQYVSYRDSKLTRILQNSLGGNANTIIICTITPASLEQTQSTLKFASCAKTIKNKPVVNVVSTDDALLKRYKVRIQDLTEQLTELQNTSVDESSKILKHENEILKQQIELLKKKFVVSQFKVPDSSTRKKLSRRETWCFNRPMKHMLPPAKDDYYSCSAVKQIKSELHEDFLRLPVLHEEESSCSQADDRNSTSSSRCSRSPDSSMIKMSSVSSQTNDGWNEDVTKLKELKEHLTKLDSLYNKSQREFEELQEFTTLEKQLLTSDCDADTIQSLLKEKKVLEEKILFFQELEKHNNSLQQESKLLEEEKQGFQKKIKEMEEENQGFQKKMKEMEEEKQGFQKKIKEMEENQSLQEKIEEMKKDSLHPEVPGLLKFETQINTLQQKIEVLEDENKGLQERIQKTDKDSLHQKGLNLELETLNSSLQQKIKILEEENQGFNERIKEIMTNSSCPDNNFNIGRQAAKINVDEATVSDVLQETTTVVSTLVEVSDLHLLDAKIKKLLSCTEKHIKVNQTGCLKCQEMREFMKVLLEQFKQFESQKESLTKSFNKSRQVIDHFEVEVQMKDKQLKDYKASVCYAFEQGYIKLMRNKTEKEALTNIIVQQKRSLQQLSDSTDATDGRIDKLLSKVQMIQSFSLVKVEELEEVNVVLEAKLKAKDELLMKALGKEVEYRKQLVELIEKVSLWKSCEIAKMAKAKAEFQSKLELELIEKQTQHRVELRKAELNSLKVCKSFEESMGTLAEWKRLLSADSARPVQCSKNNQQDVESTSITKHEQASEVEALSKRNQELESEISMFKNRSVKECGTMTNVMELASACKELDETMPMIQNMFIVAAEKYPNPEWVSICEKEPKMETDVQVIELKKRNAELEGSIEMLNGRISGYKSQIRKMKNLKDNSVMLNLKATQTDQGASMPIAGSGVVNDISVSHLQRVIRQRESYMKTLQMLLKKHRDFISREIGVSALEEFDLTMKSSETKQKSVGAKPARPVEANAVISEINDVPEKDVHPSLEAKNPVLSNPECKQQ